MFLYFQTSDLFQFINLFNIFFALFAKFIELTKGPSITIYFKRENKSNLGSTIKKKKKKENKLL